MDVWELLQWWCVQWGSKGLGRKRGIFLIVCVRELLECVEPRPDGVLCEGCRLSPTLSFFLTLFHFLSLYFFLFSFFIFLYLSPFFLFFYLSFFQASQGWHLLKTRILLWMARTWSVTLCDFPHTWTFVWKLSVQCQGLLLSVFPLQRASKCSADAVLMFSDIVCPLKWLGPRIPEGAYYA